MAVQKTQTQQHVFIFFQTIGFGTRPDTATISMQNKSSYLTTNQALSLNWRYILTTRQARFSVHLSTTPLTLRLKVTLR